MENATAIKGGPGNSAQYLCVLIVAITMVHAKKEYAYVMMDLKVSFVTKE